MTSQTPPVWALQDAKARFSQLVDTCLAQGAQIVTRRGENTVVMIPMKEWERLQASSRPTLKDVLLSEKWWTDEEPLDIPPRGSLRWKHRDIPDFSE